MSNRKLLIGSWSRVSAKLIYVAALVLAVGMAGGPLATASAASPAAPVRLSGPVHNSPLIGGTNYSIENVGEFATLESNGGNQRMTLGGNSEFYETGNAMSYGGLTWYQWELSTKDGYCIETSSNGAAHLIMAVCNSSKETQYFENPGLTDVSWLSLESTVYEGTDYAVYAENSTAVAVAPINFPSTYFWTFIKD